MADNLTTQSSTLATIPASTKISTDEDATNGHVQRVKLAYSADGVSTHVQADADGMLVNLGTNNDVTVTSGTVTANLGATDNAVLDAIAAAQLPDGHAVTVDNASGASAVNIQDGGNVISVDDGAGSLTVDNAGTFAVQVDGNALTALQLIDDIVATDDTSTHATGTTKGAVMMAAATPTDGSVDANDLGAVAMSTDRRLLVDAQIAGQDADVTIADGGNSITVDGTVTANLSATDNAVLDTIEVNTSYGDNVGGGTEAGSLRVTLANDSTGLVSVDDNGGALTVDWNGTAPPIGAGLEATALRVTLATDSTGVVSVDDNSGSLTVDNAALSVTGGGVESGALRVTLANDSTGVISVDDNAGSLTVDNAALSVTGGGVESGALRVTIANDSTGVVSVDDNGGALTVDNAGTFAVQAASAGDVAHDGADSGNPVKVGGKAYNMDGTAPGTAVAEGDRANFITDVYGRQLVTTVHPNYWHTSADYATAQTNATVKAAPGAGLRLYVTDIMISNGAVSGNITLLDGSGGTVLFELYPAANGGAAVNLRSPIALTANTLLAITSTTVTTHSVFVSGYIAP